MNKWRLASISNVVLASLLYVQAAVVPPPWADPNHNPCASQPGGWQLIYWPADKKCYRIFQRGYPCPETMELSPGPDKGTPECNCPPGSAQHHVDGLCYPIFQKGPCGPNEYFAPEPDRADRQRLGKCVEPEPCTEINTVFHPREKKCYQKYTKGPCPEGQLISTSKQSQMIGECRCDTEEMSEFYWEPGGTCHQHFTSGPCQERGGLFLPGGQCGCHNNMPHFHEPTNKCYQLGGIGPCSTGHHFTLKSKKYAECTCKDGYVKWTGDGACYRPYTRGPCSAGNMFSVNITTTGMEIGCVQVPCSTGKLYFPGGKGCHRVGTQGPCPNGQLVLFQDTVKTSVEGISYLGMCGCARYHQENTLFPTPYGSDSTNTCGQPRLNDSPTQNISQRTKEPREDICINKRGMITWSDGTCRQLYAQGPCSSGEWVVPDRGKGQRQGRGWWKGKCECRPGYTVTITINENENKTLCQAPTVVLAKFLNSKTNHYKNRNTTITNDDFDENGINIQPEHSSPKNRYITTKVPNTGRNNSKNTKLSTLHNNEDNVRTASVYYNNYRKSNRYKHNKVEPSQTTESDSETLNNKKDEINDSSIKHEESENSYEGKDTKQLNGDEKRYSGEISKHDLKEHEKEINVRIDGDVKDYDEHTRETIEKIKEINDNTKRRNEQIKNKEYNNESTNEVLKKIRNIIDARKNNRKLTDSINNIKITNTESTNTNKNSRIGRKHNLSNSTDNSTSENDTYKTHKAIQDDINDHIRKAQDEDNKQIQEERLKNHKNIDIAVVNDGLKDVEQDNLNEGNTKDEDTSNAQETENVEETKHSEEEINMNMDLEHITQANIQSKKLDESIKNHIEDRTHNHKTLYDNFEDNNDSTETLIMVEDKKDRRILDETFRRNHIKHYVKPIIIFE